MSVRYFSGGRIRWPERLRDGDVWTSKGLRFEGGEWVPYRKRSNALDRDWTAAEDEKLKAYFAAVYAGEDKRTLKEFAAGLGRSPSACHTRAGKKLGVTQQRDIKGGFCTTPTWSEAEHAILDEWYPKVPIGEVVKLLPGRSKSAVFARANVRGLVSPYAQQYRDWTDDEQRALRIAYKRGIAIADVAFAVGRNPITASKYATNHGLNFGRRPLLAASPTLDVILSLEDEAVALPPLLSHVAMQPSRVAKRRPVETNDKELRRREREKMAARRKQRRLERAAERRREALAKKQRETEERRNARRSERQRQADERYQQRLRERERIAEERRKAREWAQAHRRADVDRQSIVNARRKQAGKQALMRRAEEMLAHGKAVPRNASVHLKAALKIAQGTHEIAARQADPLEQAKLALQRRGKIVHSMAVWGGRKDLFFVSGIGRDVTTDQLLAAAERIAA